jgi:hypothetical protein
LIKRGQRERTAMIVNVHDFDESVQDENRSKDGKQLRRNNAFVEPVCLIQLSIDQDAAH